MGEFLPSLSPRMLKRIRLALRVFEWLPFPWRFSRLDAGAREDFLRRMEGSRFGLHHELLLMAKTFTTIGYAIDPQVERRLGLETSCRLSDGALPEPAGPLGDTTPPGEGEECDVVIVGSGAGGAAAAATLAEAGLDVIVLEAGQSYDRDSYPRDPLDAIASLYRDGGLTIAEGRPPIPVPVAKTVGGTTVINSGTCFRAPDEVLAHWRDRYGIGWAGDLAPDFAEAEEFLRVTPLDPERMGRNGQLAMEGAAAIGASGGPISRNAGNCVQCSSCPYGCRIDAKRAMHVSYLPRAVAAGARLRAGVEARRVLVEDGRAAGVRCIVTPPAGRDGGARPYTVRARQATIVAGGALGTPELLLRSGLGGDQVGRNLHIHPACWVGARYEEEVRGWEGVMQSYYVDEWEPQRHPARGDLHAAAVRRRLAARLGPRAPGVDAPLRQRRLDRRPASGRVEWQGRDRARRLGAGQLRAYRGRREPHRLRDRTRSRDPLRRRSAPRSIRTSAAPRSCAPATSPASRQPPSSPRSYASRPSTRWGRRGSLPSRARASARPTARSTASPASTSPTPRSSRPRSGSTR